MAFHDLSIRNRLALWAIVGVVLVGGMLVNQLIGEHCAASQRAEADGQQLAAIEALRAADDLRSMQMEALQIRLAIAPGEVDRALYRVFGDQTAAAGHIETALSLTPRPTDQERLNMLGALVKSYGAAVHELAAAAKDYGDTVGRVKRINEIGTEINGLLETTTTALIAAARERQEEAEAQTLFVNRLNLGIGLFITAVFGSLAAFGALSISRPIRRIGDVLLELARGNKEVEIPYRDRHDEVGDNARAAQSFKETLIRIEHLEAAEKETARRAAEQRRADTQTLAGAFERTVASVVRSDAPEIGRAHV